MVIFVTQLDFVGSIQDLVRHKRITSISCVIMYCTGVTVFNALGISQLKTNANFRHSGIRSLTVNPNKLQVTNYKQMYSAFFRFSFPENKKRNAHIKSCLEKSYISNVDTGPL